MGRARCLAWFLILLAPAGAEAQLAVRTLEHGGWARSVAALQTDLGSEGRALHVVVTDPSSARSPCGRYQLVLDDYASRAFDVDGCDPATGATVLRLVDRLALFELGDVVARPRRVGVAAIEVRHGSARGGARLRAETELRCSVAARPYLVDYATGARVLATPERFAMRPVGEGVVVEADGEGWTLRAGSMRIEYELLDRVSGEIVLRETVELRCGRPAGREPEARQDQDVVRLVPHRVFRGATMTRRRTDDHGSCGGHEGPEQWYVVQLDAPTRLGLRLVSEFDATLYIRQGAIDGPEIACRDESALLETFDMNLPAGTYYVAVDGSGTHGRYRLIEFEEPVDPRALEEAPHGELSNHERVGARLVAAPSRYRASCGGDQAPEHVYFFHVPRPSFVALRLASLFDASLYLFAADGEELGCRSALGQRGDIRHAHLRQELGAGLYYVVVDGESGHTRTGAYSLDLHQLPLH